MSGTSPHRPSPVAANISAELARTKMSAAELARRLGTHERMARRWRRGETQPSWKYIVGIARIFERDTGWFYTEHPAKPTRKAA